MSDGTIRVAFSGPAGVGKTTLGLYIAVLLREKGIDFNLYANELTEEEALKRIVDMEVKGIEPDALGKIVIEV